MIRAILKFLFRTVLVLAIVIGLLFVTGPYEPVEKHGDFDATVLAGGIDAYLQQAESQVADIRPGGHKRMVWAGEPEAKTSYSVVYLHGFSAAAEEIRPVPDRVAEALGANLYFARLTGHGRSGPDAMAEATVADWRMDTQEALAIGRATGEKVIIISTSTGGTLAALALHNAELRQDVAGAVFVSPNFGINNPAAPILTLPAARFWLPLAVGARRGFEPLNERQARHWTTDYPTVAALPMAALVKHTVALDFSAVKVPALFYYSEADRVVSPDMSAQVMNGWGGPVLRAEPAIGEGVSPYAHVIAGDIVSPGNTDAAVAQILEWANGLN